MLIIGENIQIISPEVKEAIAGRDAQTMQRLAKSQVEHGAQILDLNIGPQKKEGPEVMRWLVPVIEEVADVPLSLDTTNLEAIRAGLSLAKHRSLVNSASAEPERLERVPPIAAEYNAGLIALMMGKSGIPLSAEERVSIALDQLVPRAMEVGIPMENLYLDPLVLTVSGCQEFCPPAVEAVRYVKQGMDPAPLTTCGLSNVSNRVPHENRSLLNRTYLVMLMAAGLDTAIADPLDKELMNVIRIIDERDDSTAAGSLLLTLYDRTMAMEELEQSDVSMSEPDQVAIWKTVQVLMNKTIYSDSYLRD
ncbi:MAG TPA: dihydropteroate synthase [Thermoleophilia bacterium]|nr:dihydropteroate synthase [Thermoleophilia bacterium]